MNLTPLQNSAIVFLRKIQSRRLNRKDIEPKDRELLYKLADAGLIHSKDILDRSQPFKITPTGLLALFRKVGPGLEALENPPPYGPFPFSRSSQLL